ncbi:MAG TPA: succinyl-diaminopimelate desuccinylase, partial [Rhodospirillaceae bacterium]|nr:succinyl-diaminopimelate desuccinylase [Rhodospirillaceae bacterium]
MNPNTATDDPIALAKELIRCPSVTPEDGGAIDILESALTGLGFECTRLRFSDSGTPDVDNLYARLGRGGSNFCFAGHTDVVPVGDTEAWSLDPFAGEVRNGHLYGRGAADMKSAIAAFTVATHRVVARYGSPDNWDKPGSISFLITGDEEGPAINGTRKVLDWITDKGE